MLSAISVLFPLLCMQIDINKFVSGIQSISLIPTILRLIHSILYTRLSISVDSGNLWVCPSMTLKCPFPSGNPDPHLMHGSWGCTSSLLKRHVDRFSRFSTVHGRDQQTDHATAVMTVRILCQWRSQGRAGRGHAPPRNWVHKKILGCAVELNTQNCVWFGSQISLTTAMSFREAMPPRTTHQGLCPWTSLGDFRSPDPLCSPTSKSWLRHCLMLRLAMRPNKLM